MFFVYSKAAKCWEQIGLHSLVQELPLSENNFSTMIFDLLKRLAPQQQFLAAMVLIFEAYGGIVTLSFGKPQTTHQASLLLKQRIHLMNGVVCEAQCYRFTMRISLIFEINHVWARSDKMWSQPPSTISLSLDTICVLETLMDHSCLANHFIITPPPRFSKLKP